MRAKWDWHWGSRVARVVAPLLLMACADAKVYRVGVVLGAEGEHGAQLAADDLNAEPGARIELRALRSAYGTSAQVALQGAESLAVDPTVLGVVGHANSSASLAASQVYNARHVVQIAPTSTAPLYSDAGPYSFRMVASDAHQARFLVSHIPDSVDARIAVVYANDDYGRALRGLVLDALQERNLRPVYQGPYAESDTDGTDVVRALVSARPTLLLWLGREPFFARIVTPLRAALPALPVLASDGFGSTKVTRDLDHRLDGVRYVRLVDLDSGSARLRALESRYRDAGYGEITDQAALAYDAVMLLGTAIRETGGQREAVREWLNQLGRSRPAFVGATGPITFTPDGDRTPSYHLATVGGEVPSAGR